MVVLALTRAMQSVFLRTFKRNTIEDRTIKLQTPQRVKPQQQGPEDAKRVDLAIPGEEPKPVYIATDLSPEEEERLLATL